MSDRAWLGTNVTWVGVKLCKVDVHHDAGLRAGCEGKRRVSLSLCVFVCQEQQQQQQHQQHNTTSLSHAALGINTLHLIHLTHPPPPVHTIPLRRITRSSHRPHALAHSYRPPLARSLYLHLPAARGPPPLPVVVVVVLLNPRPLHRSLGIHTLTARKRPMLRHNRRSFRTSPAYSFAAPLAAGIGFGHAECPAT